MQLQRATNQLPKRGWVWHRVISMVINRGCARGGARAGAPQGPPCPSTFLGSPQRVGKEAEPPNSFISSRTFPNRWEKIAIKNPNPETGKYNELWARGKINAEGYLCSMGSRQIKSEIPIKSIIYFNGNNKIRDGPKRRISDWDPDPNGLFGMVPCRAISILW